MSHCQIQRHTRTLLNRESSLMRHIGVFSLLFANGASDCSASTPEAPGDPDGASLVGTASDWVTKDGGLTASFWDIGECKLSCTGGNCEVGSAAVCGPRLWTGSAKTAGPCWLVTCWWWYTGTGSEWPCTGTPAKQHSECCAKNTARHVRPSCIHHGWCNHLERTRQQSARSRSQHHQLRSLTEDASVSAVLSAPSALVALCNNALHKLTLTFDFWGQLSQQWIDCT